MESAQEKYTPTEEELNDLSLACTKLWDLDENYLIPFEDYELDLQKGKKAYNHQDQAKDPLFKSLNESIWEKPTYAAFMKILDNYEKETGIQEEVSKEERWENWNFLETILQTPIMKYLHLYLIKQGKVSDDEGEFKKQLYKIWFQLYKREERNDSSGFEHVFLGEVRDGKVIGCHNWIQIYLNEKKGDLDYKGWVLPRRKSKGFSNEYDLTGEEQLITIQFDWEGHEKQVCSTFIGTSPEFEFALYTLIFYCGKDENHLELADYNVNIKCFSMYGGKYIATCFPVAE